MSFDPDLHRHTIKLPNRVGEARHGGLRPLEMSVLDAGPADADGDKSAAPTMVFLHGLGGRAAYWAAQMEQFEDDYRVVALDLRGHGYTDAPDESDGARYDVPELVADIASALDVLGVPQRFILVCHSFGGALAADFINRFPQRVSALVIIASAVRFRLRWPGRLLLRVPPKLLGYCLDLLPLVSKESAHLWPPAHVVYLQNKNGLAPWDGSAALAAIKTPTLVILGHRDILFSAASYEDVARLIPGAEQVVIPVSAHQVMVERPDAVNRAIERFLQAQGDPLALAGARQAHRAARRAARKDMEQQRPWLKFYDVRTPYRIKMPSVPLPRLLEATARRFGNTTALYFFGRTISWRELNRLADRFAHGLIKRGIKPGERVMLTLPNMPQWVIAYYGILKAGGIAVLVDAGIDEQRLLDRVLQSGAVMLVTSNERHAALREAFPVDPRVAGLRRVVLASPQRYMGWREKIAFAGTYVRGWLRTPRWLQSQAQRIAFRRYFSRFSEMIHGRMVPLDLTLDIDAVAAIVYTHGTTGAPMAVPLTHRNLAANALQLRHWLPEARPGDERFLAQLRLSSAYGLTGLLHLGVYLGASLILLPDATLPELLKSVQRLQPTYFPTTPDIVRRLAQISGVRRYGLASIRVCAVSGAPLALESREEFEKITRGRLLDAYGLSEAGPAVLAMPVASRRGSGVVGIALPDTELKIVDLDTGREAGADMPGQLWVRGPQVFAGYDMLAADDLRGAARQSLRHSTDGGGDWLVTGDIASMDEDGFVSLIDREQNMLVRDGHRIFPRQVEEILFEHPAVALATVKTVPDAGGYMTLRAFVLMHRNMRVEAEELLSFVSKYLRASAVPDSISIEYPQ